MLIKNILFLTALTFSSATQAGWLAQGQHISIDGQVQGIYAADYDADHWPDLLVVSSRGRQRFIDVYDGRRLQRQDISQPHKIAVPRDVSFFDLCPALGAGLVWLRAGRIEHMSAAGVLRTLARLPDDSYRFYEEGDLERVRICVEADIHSTENSSHADSDLVDSDQGSQSTAPLLMIPGVGHSELLRADMSTITLQTAAQVFMINGDRYRGPRARRDISLMTMLISPRQQAGHLQGAQSWDLSASLEDQLLIFSQQSIRKASASTRIKPDNSVVLGPRTAKQRRQHRGLVDIQLRDFNGDGIDDALLRFQDGQSSDIRTHWQIIAGPLQNISQAKVLADERFDGLVSPLLPVDLDGNGAFALLEGRVDTGIMDLGKALVTGHVVVSYRLHRFAHGRQLRSARWSRKQSLKLRGSAKITALPPLLNADYDDDGLIDFVALGQNKRLQIFAGQRGAQPFADEASLDKKIPAARQVISLRRGQKGAKVIAICEDRGAQSGLELLYIKALKSR